MPELSTVEWLEPFEVWLGRYLADIEKKRTAAFARITAFIEAQARENPQASPFRCVCGEETRDPLDPAWMALHRPHIGPGTLRSGRRGRRGSRVAGSQLHSLSQTSIRDIVRLRPRRETLARTLST